MPMPPIDQAVSANESTMRSGAIRSGYLSAARLQRRYRNIDFENAARELCLFLRNKGADGKYAADSLFNKYRTAERAIYPKFGAVGLNRDNNLCTALYYWMAANDTSADIVSSVVDRREAYVRALFESQRGNNAKDSEDHTTNSGRINFEDNESATDSTICSWGTNNKFAECFLAMHPEVELIDSLKTSIFELALGFIADYLYSKGMSFRDIVSPFLALENETLLPLAIKNDIKQKIIEIFGKANESYEGFLTATEITYLNDLFGTYLESLQFTTYPTEDKLKQLIHDAKVRLSDALLEHIARRARLNAIAIPAGANPSFELDLIAAIIVSVLPQPTNSSCVHGFVTAETLSFRPGSNELVTVRGAQFSEVLRNTFARARAIYSSSYSAGTLAQAMQSQPPTISSDDAREVRHQRRAATGARPNVRRR